MSTQLLLRIRSRRAGSLLLNASYQSKTFFLSPGVSAACASAPIIVIPRKKSIYRRRSRRRAVPRRELLPLGGQRSGEAASVGARSSWFISFVRDRHRG